MAYRINHVTMAEGRNEGHRTYRQISVRPLGGALGAEIDGLDLAKPLSAEQVAEVRQALLDHLVIFFRDQTLTPEQHKAFAANFGTFHTHEYVDGLPDHPEIMVIHKQAGDRLNFGGDWHSDVTYARQPPLGSILYAKAVPDHGGDTLWANMYLAYETLSDGLRGILDGLSAVHTARMIYGPDGAYGNQAYGKDHTGTRVRASDQADAVSIHPVVRTHPETDRRLLFVNAPFTLKFHELSEAESEPLLQYLYRHATRPDFTCRFRWRAGDVAFWDNRCTQHYALNDYQGKARLMHRITLAGDTPR